MSTDFFFFQAEDGIRDIGVTGVQTCALPILLVGRPKLDLADPSGIEDALVETGGDVIVNAAAYTAVDQAESAPELAEAINGIGAGVVAGVAAAMNVPLIHLSTDYVFDGTADHPYPEDDPVAPLGAYGASKLLGEEAVAAEAENYAILRTAWIYSPFGKNFVKTMLRLAGEREEIGIVADQHGSPTRDRKSTRLNSSHANISYAVF